MDEIETSKISKIIVDEIYNLPLFIYEDKQLPDPSSLISLAKIRKEHKLTRFVSMHGWFLRLSWLQKIDILKRLAWCTTNLHTIVLSLNTIYTATSKDWIYSANQGLNLFKSDKILNDHNRALDAEILPRVIDDQINWYKTLKDSAQYTVMTDMIKLADSCVIGKIFYEFLIIFKSRLREILKSKYLQELQISPTSEEKSEKKGKKKEKGKKAKKGKKDKHAKKEEVVITEEEMMAIQKEEERKKELDDIFAFLNEKFVDDPKDPLTIELDGLIKKWDIFIGAYNKKLGINQPPKKTPKKKDKGKKGKKKKEKINKNLPDDIQLLPIWINKTLISSIDPKAFKNAKKVNKYWTFIAKGIKKDIKCRQSLNRNCEILKKGIKVCNFEKTLPINKPSAKYLKISDVTDQTIQSKFMYKAQTTKTLISDLYKTCAEFNISDIKLQSFPKYVDLTKKLSYSGVLSLYQIL